MSVIAKIERWFISMDKDRERKLNIFLHKNLHKNLTPVLFCNNKDFFFRLLHVLVHWDWTCPGVTGVVKCKSTWNILHFYYSIAISWITIPHNPSSNRIYWVHNPLQNTFMKSLIQVCNYYYCASMKDDKKWLREFNLKYNFTVSISILIQVICLMETISSKKNIKTILSVMAKG